MAVRGCRLTRVLAGRAGPSCRGLIVFGWYGRMALMTKALSSDLPDLAALEALDGRALRGLYRRIVGEPPPEGFRAELLRSNIAWALQARAEGHHPPTLRKRLLRTARGLTARQQPPAKPGTRLIREWHGTVHEVVVLEQGYRWQGQHFRSLSPIAEAITGAHWSGRRFFGLAPERRGHGTA